MTRYHYSKRPAGARGERRRNVTDQGPEKQATALSRPYMSVARQEATLERWDAGTAKLEAKMAKARATVHAFIPMGSLPACEKCGSGLDELLNGNRIHYS